jgi:hypothetical protein
MSPLPNPFVFHAGASDGCGTAAAPDLTDPPVAAAEESRFVLDEAGFMNDIEQLPAFLISPRREYLDAAQIRPIVDVLAAHL